MQTAMCPTDGAFLRETIDDGPVDPEDVFAGMGFDCPLCFRWFHPEDARIWHPWASPGEVQSWST